MLPTVFEFVVVSKSDAIPAVAPVLGGEDDISFLPLLFGILVFGGPARQFDCGRLDQAFTESFKKLTG